MNKISKLSFVLLAIFFLMIIVEMPVSAKEHKHKKCRTSFSVNLNLGTALRSHYVHDYYLAPRPHAVVHHLHPYSERVIVHHPYPTYYREEVHVYPSYPGYGYYPGY